MNKIIQKVYSFCKKQGKIREPYFLYGEVTFIAAHPAIFPREEKIGKEIQNSRYARFFIPQRR